jgi:hypothetical protein
MPAMPAVQAWQSLGRKTPRPPSNVAVIAPELRPDRGPRCPVCDQYDAAGAPGIVGPPPAPGSGALPQGGRAPRGRARSHHESSGPLHDREPALQRQGR